MERSEKLFYLVADPATSTWIRNLNPTAESLHDAYEVGLDRMSSYHRMVERILEPVRGGQTVCAAFYGHPGVLVYPGHEAVRQARSEGYRARMLPGISAVACLFAELGVDPGAQGSQMYDATSFVFRKRRFDPTSSLILWQIGCIAVATYMTTRLWGPEGLLVLQEILQQDYPAGHEVVIYEASGLPTCPSRVTRIPLRELAKADVTGVSTLYVPPLETVEYDWEVIERLSRSDS
jgi:uncharacterized protein YabN with tetrapyrrole methylase and pyrophosphatase domain